ncbi:hypothetical protein [Gardnerella swidsinskii]|uniref:hypothetical protein n=1 Tax=Gardnerella TaxID=2701 RepID=UPI0001D85821|nr:hypothetical protein [Gardnerella swidsinskii]EFH71969.1 putative kinase [Gardnerella vaginalis 5-1]MDK8691692.1 hypothetical protein [Gardnerella swidsinskii]RIY25980.1 hypothetical protein CJI51_05055 [Bifidobacteriaceae bacterium WP021]
MSYKEDEQLLSEYIINTLGHKNNDVIVYSLIRTKKRSWIIQLLDLIIFTGAGSDLDEIGDNLARHYYLIASNNNGLIVAVIQGKIKQIASLSQWNFEDIKSWKKTIFDGYIYRKTSQVKL